MSRLVQLCFRLWLPLLGGLALWLAGCSDNDRLSYATEQDEPNYREGESLLKTGRKQEALTSFLKVITKRGDDAPESHLEVGLLYLQHINDPLSAIYHFRKYLALRPNSPQAPLVRQRIDAATREFARTLPAQPMDNQPQRVDLIAALDRLKQENDSLKQQLADAKAGRNIPGPATDDADAATTSTASSGLNFSVETIPTVRTRPVAAAPARPAVSAITTAPARPAISPAQNQPVQSTTSAKPASGRKYVVRPGDTLSKIAQSVYNNRGKWHDIYAANRGVMKSETDLKVGMELKLP